MLSTPNGCCSVFEEIEEQSRTLSAKSGIAQFADKEEDTKVVARLVEQLREAVVCYQVGKAHTSAPSTVDVKEQMSQQQSIYHQITNLTVRIFGLFSIPLANDWPFHLVIIWDPLETSRGDAVQPVRHNIY